MSEMSILPMRSFGHDFIPPEYLPEGQDEYYLRNGQVGKPADHWRNLRTDEIEILVRNGNACEDWGRFLVTDQFNPNHIKRSEFYGLVRIGRIGEVSLSYHEMSVPTGITNSRIISCDIGDDVAIHNVHYLAHYILGDYVLLMNVDEMHATNHAKFGNGIVKEGEEEPVRTWIHVMNENGARRVMPFDGMIPADACLWAKYRDDDALQRVLGRMTQNQHDARRGYYGTVGDYAVIKTSRIIKDVRIGPCCYIKGANKLKNLTINSSEREPTQIGEGVELVNGIVGPGCHVFYGCKAVRFIMGANSSLKYGARLINSILGDNSTVSCCEILNNLIFPAHEQHHNNSFLVASVVMGQSNIAAGATIGSNHNSRANDGEIQAGRGFWPGLCVTLKHPSRFTSFVLLAKGDYPAELDIPLPFSLVDSDPAGNRLTIMPAYWWMYNLYALARNAWKVVDRDTRATRTQNIEFDYLAPDTAEEILVAMRLLETWTARARLKKLRRAAPRGADRLAKLGRDLLTARTDRTASLEVLGEGIENSARKAVLLKVRPAYRAYRQMLLHYAARNLTDWMKEHPRAGLADLCRELSGPRQAEWVNLGGQLAPAEDVDRIRADIKAGRLACWSDVHAAYDALWSAYPQAKRHHAMAVLREILGVRDLTAAAWNAFLDEAVEIQRYVADQVYRTRRKDYDDPFRRITFRNDEEMRAVLGEAEDSDLVRKVRKETANFEKLVAKIRKRG